MSAPTTYLGQHNINFAIRPERLGYLVRNGSKDELAIAIAEATTRWGGMTEPIISYDSEGTLGSGFALTTKHPVDRFVAAGPCSDADLATLRRAVSVDVWPIARVHELGLHQLAVQPRVDSDDKGMILVTPTEPWPPNVYAARPADSLSAMAAAGVVDEAGWEAWNQFGHPLTAFDWPDNYLAQLGRRTVIHASVAQASDLSGSEVGFLPTVIVMVSDGGVGDAIYFWNLRASVRLRTFDPIECVLIDLATLERHDVLEHLASRSREGFEQVTPAILVVAPQSLHSAVEAAVSSEWEIDRSPDFSISATRRPPDTVTRATVVRFVEPRILDVRRRVVGGGNHPLVQFERHRTVVDVASPVEFARRLGYVRARFWGAPPLQIPPGAGHGRLFHEVAYVFDRAIEIITSPAPHYDFTLRIPEAQELLASSLADCGVAYILSDKGKMATGVAARFKDLTPLRDPTFQRCIRSLTTQRVQYDIAKLRAQFPGSPESDLERIATQLIHVRQTFRSIAGIASVAEMPESECGRGLEQLVLSGIVDRGFSVRCGQCGLDYFMEMSTLEPDLQCPGCFSPVQPTPHAGRGEMELYYRLNTLVDRASDNGVMGHLWLMDAFKRHDANAFVLPGVELTLPGNTRREADALALVGSEIWSGEVKPFGRLFDHAQLTKDLEIAAAVRASHYVMAAADEISPDVVRTAIQTFGAAGIYVWTYRAPGGTLTQRIVA